MSFLKTTWSALSAAFMVALVIFAGAAVIRQKNQAEKWKGKAVDIELGNVVKGVKSAEAASTKAKLHDATAGEKKKAAEARITKIGEKNEAVADILDRWRKS